MRVCLLYLCIAITSACARTDPPTEHAGKIEGPTVAGLSHEQLAALLKECTQYGKMDDARVPYTAAYCSTVMSAHLSEGYGKSVKPDVDPAINRLH